MRLRRSSCATRRKPSPMQRLRLPDGPAAALLPKSGMTQPPTRSKTWSAPPSAASSNPHGAAAHFPLAAATHHSEEVKEVMELEDSRSQPATRGSSPLPPLPHLLPLPPATGLKFSLGVTHANNDFTFAIKRRFFGQQFCVRHRYADVFGKLPHRRGHARLHAGRGQAALDANRPGLRRIAKRQLRLLRGCRRIGAQQLQAESLQR